MTRRRREQDAWGKQRVRRPRRRHAPERHRRRRYHRELRRKHRRRRRRRERGWDLLLRRRCRIVPPWGNQRRVSRELFGIGISGDRALKEPHVGRDGRFHGSMDGRERREGRQWRHLPVGVGVEVVAAHGRKGGSSGNAVGNIRVYSGGGGNVIWGRRRAISDSGKRRRTNTLEAGALGFRRVDRGGSREALVGG